MNLSRLHAPAPGTYVFIVRLLMLLILTCGVGYAVLSLNSPVLKRVMPEAGAQPYALTTSNKVQTHLTFTLRYFAWQNGTFSFELPDACVTSVFIQPEGLSAHVLKLPEGKPLCDEARLDLTPFLLPGVNIVSLGIASYQVRTTEIYAAPVVFWAHATSTLATLCIFAVFALALFTVAQRAGLDKTACLILTAGFACYALLLHVRPNLYYSNDLTGHVTYIRYMLKNGLRHPYGYDGWEHFQPPLYYFIGSLIFDLGDGGGPIGPLTLVRMLSLFFYMVFLFFGLLTLRASLEGKGAPYYIGILLLVFWPTGPLFATRINNDIPVCAAWAIAFYFLVRWFRDERLGWFQLAVAFTGIAFMFKSSAFSLIAVTSVCTLWRLAARKLPWRDLVRPRSLLAFGIFILSVLENTGRYIGILLHGGGYMRDYLADSANEKHTAGYFLHFDVADYIAYPEVTFAKEPSYLNYFLKTMLYNEQQLDQLKWLPGILNIVLLVMLVLTAVFSVRLFMRRRHAQPVLIPLIMGAALPPFGPLLLMLINEYMFSQNFRYVVPMIIPLIALYARGLETASGARAGRLLYWPGIAAGICMIVCGIAMNGWLYSNGHFD